MKKFTNCVLTGTVTQYLLCLWHCRMVIPSICLLSLVQLPTAYPSISVPHHLLLMNQLNLWLQSTKRIEICLRGCNDNPLLSFF